MAMGGRGRRRRRRQRMLCEERCYPRTVLEKEEENRVVDLKNSRLEQQQQQQQVKIKISKKQLEGLVSRGDHDRFRGLSMEQVLLQLIKINYQCNYIANDEQQGQEEQIKSWRPSLQSIPELN
ncbi:hypothetical protein Syun_026978 [Stephania yunnanensis]|uniref:Uncharacterized protein n=1 Tax=Stephania yunnanensis TaxID=152371 RepID=A0AAP0HPI3_9MAGN